MADESVRRALYVLFARLLAGPPDAALYARLEKEGLKHLAEVQGLDLTSDLVDPADAESCASELEAEYASLRDRVSLRASDFDGGDEDPVVAVSAFLDEHGLETDPGLPCDHLSVALGIMGQLAGRAEAPRFFRGHVGPWAQQALAELASQARRRYYRGLAAMVSAFLESERRAYEKA